MFFKIFILKNSFLKNGVLEIWSEPLIVSFWNNFLNDNYVNNQNKGFFILSKIEKFRNPGDRDQDL